MAKECSTRCLTIVSRILCRTHRTVSICFGLDIEKPIFHQRLPSSLFSPILNRFCQHFDFQKTETLNVNQMLTSGTKQAKSHYFLMTLNKRGKQLETVSDSKFYLLIIRRIGFKTYQLRNRGAVASLFVDNGKYRRDRA